MLRLTTKTLSLAGTACIAAILLVSPASAIRPAPAATHSAYGCSYWASNAIPGRTIPTGMYCVNIDGAGRYVKWVGGGFNTVGQVCNWQVTAEFFDSDGRWYQTLSAPIRYGCARSANEVIWIAATKRAGRMCSTLKTNGTRLTSVCHSIY